jgi:hypothetical protein
VAAFAQNRRYRQLIGLSVSPTGQAFVSVTANAVREIGAGVAAACRADPGHRKRPAIWGGRNREGRICRYLNLYELNGPMMID